MKLKKLAISDKAIKVTSEAVIGKAGEVSEDNTRDFTDTIREQPLGEFTKAIEGLTSVALSACELDKSYSSGLTVTRFDVRYTKQGSRSVILHCEKSLEASEKPFKFKTNQIHIDSPTDGENFVMEVKPGLAAKAQEAIFAAEKYRDGERSQALLFNPDSGTEEGEDEFKMEG